ncbi:hypothetical protein Esti_003864 [Eimeria stiedai]
MRERSCEATWLAAALGPLNGARLYLRRPSLPACFIKTERGPPGRVARGPSPALASTSDLHTRPRLEARGAPLLGPLNPPPAACSSSCCSASSSTGEATRPSQQQQQQQGFATASFLPMGLLPSVRDSLLRWGVSNGSSIQAAALPLLLQGRSVCMAGETGSGKTLAYVAALVQRVVVLQQLQQLQPRQQQQQEAAAAGKFPVAIVLVPSRELALQVLGWMRRLLQFIPGVSPSAAGLLLGSSPAWPYRSRSLPAGSGGHPGVLVLGQGGPPGPPGRVPCCPSLLVSTPHAFAAAARKETGLFAAAETLVLDEADMLLEGGYKQDTASLLSRFKAADRGKRRKGRPLTQYILAAATLPSGAPLEGPLPEQARGALPGVTSGGPAEGPPRGLPRGGPRGALEKRFPLMHFVESPLLHRHSRGLLQQFISVSAEEGEEQRIDRLVETLRGPLRDLKTLVFCNTAATAKRVCEGLKKRLQQQQQQLVSLFSSQLPPLARARALKQFSSKTLAVETAAAAEAADAPQKNAATADAPQKNAATAEVGEAASSSAAAAAEGSVLVCTDAAARGLHLEGLGAVVQFDFATSAVSHLHRVGRVARAGRQGLAVSFFQPHQQALVEAIRGQKHVQQLQQQQQQQQQGWEGSGGKDHSLAAAFSRKRSFAKKLKKRSAAAAAADAATAAAAPETVQLGCSEASKV